MDLKEMESAALETRKAEIGALADTAPAEQLGALEEELREIQKELTARAEAEAQRRAIAEQVIQGAGEVQAEKAEERKENAMTNMEIRNTKPYIDAFAEYVKTGKDDECRALLTENVSGTVPIPEFVYDIVKTAWERDEIARRIRKVYLKGNLKVGFEISSTGATKHTEGASAVSEETLVLGTVTLVAGNYMKWLSLSKEVLTYRGEQFLRYIYDEIVYHIARAMVNDLLDKIVACATTATTTQVRVGVVESSTISVGLVAEALGKLSDEARNPIVVMNKATWSAFKAAQYAAQYPIDPFEGLPVAFNNHLTEFSAATTGVPYVIVGDFDFGSLANFPDDENVDWTIDNITEMKKGMVNILGSELAAVEPVACDAFVQIVGA